MNMGNIGLKFAGDWKPEYWLKMCATIKLLENIVLHTDFLLLFPQNGKVSNKVKGKFLEIERI